MQQNNFQQQSDFNQNNNFLQQNNNFVQNDNNGFQQNNQQVQVQEQQPTEPTSSPYTNYDDLPNYGENVNVSEVIENMKVWFEDKTNWKNVFDAIDNLRILNKYYSKDINDIINLFWGSISNCMDSQKTSIVKNILVFLREVFTFTAKEVRLRDEVIQAALPHIFKLSISEKKLIKAEIEGIIEEFVTHCCFDASIQCLCSIVFDKNAAVAENALFTLAKMVSNIGENLPQLSFNSLQMLMITLAKMLDSAKKGNMKKWATQLCQSICNLFGMENYVSLVQGTMAEQPAEITQHLAKAIEEKKETKRESKIHDFVQEQKKMMRYSMYQNNNNNNQGGFNSFDNNENQMQFNGFGNQQKMNSQNILGDQFNNGGYGMNNFQQQQDFQQGYSFGGNNHFSNNF